MIRCIVGAGAQGRVVLENWRAQWPGAKFVFVDDNAELHGQTILGVEVVGAIEKALKYTRVVLALGNNEARATIAKLWDGHVTWGTVIHPSAVVSPSAIVAEGAVVFAGAVINTQAIVRAHAVINTGVIVEHDCAVDRFASVSPGVRMAGRVTVGEGAFIGTGATLLPRVKVGAWSVVGAGAVVTKDTDPKTMNVGVPSYRHHSFEEMPWGSLL